MLDAIYDDYSPDGAEFGPHVERRSGFVAYTANPQIVGLCSPCMGSGKSVVAYHLRDVHGFVIVKFAGFLKDMCRTMLTGIGIDAETVERMVEGDLKQVDVAQLGCTPRWLLQSLGTEWGRQCIRPDLWVHLARVVAEGHLAAGRSVVFDDMRFFNEYELIKAMNGTPVRIWRPGKQVEIAHASEGELDNVHMEVIENTGSIADLQRAADTLLR